VKIRNIAGNKFTFTVILSMHDGTKLPPILIFKNKNHIPKSLKIKYSQKALIYSTLMVGNMKEDEYKPLLIMDEFSVHKMEVIKQLPKVGKSLYSFILTGCPGLLQPLDTHINRVFKDKVHKSFKFFSMIILGQSLKTKLQKDI